MIEIEGAHFLEALFGHWPSFHDAEIRAARLLALRDTVPHLELDIEVAELFADARGVYRDRQRCVATFRFSNVRNVRVDAFRQFQHEKALGALEFADRASAERGAAADDSGGGRYRVRLIPSRAVADAQFFCDQVAVLTATSISLLAG